MKNQDDGLKVPLFNLKQCHVYIDAKISLVPKHQLIVPSTLLALARNIRTYKNAKPQIYIRSHHWHMSYMRIANGQFWNWLVHKEVFTVFKSLVCSSHHNSQVNSLRKTSMSFFSSCTSGEFYPKGLCLCSCKVLNRVPCQEEYNAMTNYKIHELMRWQHNDKALTSESNLISLKWV